MHPDPEFGTRSEEGGPCILILDPDSRIAEALALALRRRTRVEWVTSGMAALLVAGERGVDLVITRGHLPDIPPDDFSSFYACSGPACGWPFWARRRRRRGSWRPSQTCIPPSRSSSNTC